MQLYGAGGIRLGLLRVREKACVRFPMLLPSLENGGWGNGVGGFLM